MSVAHRVVDFYQGLGATVFDAPRTLSLDGMTLIEYVIPPGQVVQRSGIRQFVIHLAIEGNNTLKRRRSTHWESEHLSPDDVTFSPPEHWSIAEWNLHQRRFSVYLSPEKLAALSGLDPAIVDPERMHGNIRVCDPDLLASLRAVRYKFWDDDIRCRNLALDGLAAEHCVDLVNRHTSFRKFAQVKNCRITVLC